MTVKCNFEDVGFITIIKSTGYLFLYYYIILLFNFLYCSVQSQSASRMFSKNVLTKLPSVKILLQSLFVFFRQKIAFARLILKSAFSQSSYLVLYLYLSPCDSDITTLVLTRLISFLTLPPLKLDYDNCLLRIP